MEEDEAKEISQKILEQMEDQINRITQDRSKGRCGQIYKVRELVEGPKKSGQEAQAVKDPANGEIVVNTLTDIVKFYDKEMLNDAILATHGTVNRKALRLDQTRAP